MGLITAYGPNSTLGTKLVVSVLERPGQPEPTEMRKWTTESTEIRHDPAIAAEVADFLQQYHVKQTLTHDQLIGCPHEEGIDYPMGRTCPRCPFWADLDRFAQEPRAAAPTMTPEEILANLSIDDVEPPYDALESADGHREALVEPLLNVIDAGVANPAGATPEQATLFSYALYLLARWRETRAYPHMIRWLSLPDEGPFEIAGDIVTEDGGRILAAVCDGDLDPIKALVLDRRANEYGRGAGVRALSLLAAWAEVPRESIAAHFLWLAREGLEREPNEVWRSLASDGADIEARSLFPELRRAYADGLIDPQFMHPSELDAVEAAPPGSLLERTREDNAPIDDVVEATEWWARDPDPEDPDLPPEPYRAPPRVGRNEPCPCGSGKKFKKCCGN